MKMRYVIRGEKHVKDGNITETYRYLQFFDTLEETQSAAVEKNKNGWAVFGIQAQKVSWYICGHKANKGDGFTHSENHAFSFDEESAADECVKKLESQNFEQVFKNVEYPVQYTYKLIDDVLVPV